jgi:hypothetical protein
MSALLPPAGLTATRGLWSKLRAFSRHGPPPSLPADQVLYGLAQPVVGARVLLSERGLLIESLVPAAFLGAFCALVASVSHESPGWLGWWAAFYKIFAVLAPLPSLIFANHYARLAAMVRWRLGFGAVGPREMPFDMLVGRMIRQALIVAVGVLPFAAVPQLVPGIGNWLSNIVVAIWGIHWVVADAFDDAQVLLPGETLRKSLQHDREAPPPWFVRWMNRAADRLPGFVGRPLHWFARFCDRLAMDSRGEIHVMEQNKFISLGFALSTAALMAIPILNLFFRPVILVASSHLLGHLEPAESLPEKR